MKREIDQRKLISNPRPHYWKLFIGYCFKNKRGKSTIMNEVLMEKFDRMTKEEREALMKTYSLMTEEQIKNPKLNSEES